MAGSKNALSKNPDEAARNMKAQMYTKSLDGGPPSTEYTKKGVKTTGPENPLTHAAPRNRDGKS